MLNESECESQTYDDDIERLCYLVEHDTASLYLSILLSRDCMHWSHDPRLLDTQIPDG